MLSVLIVSIVLVYTWLVAPIAPRSTVVAPVLTVLGLAVFRAFRTGEWGFGRAAFLPALSQSAVATIIAAAVMAIAGWRAGTWHDPHNGWSRLVLLIPWGFGQQFVLQTALLRDAQRAAGRSGGIFIAALAFAMLHAPNPFLVATTFVGALVWCWQYNRHPHVVPPALSHALLTLAVLYAFDNDAIGGLRVGDSYRR